MGGAFAREPRLALVFGAFGPVFLAPSPQPPNLLPFERTHPMALKDLANVTISTSGPALTQVGFGTVLCAAYAASLVFGAQEYTRIYTDLAPAVADGFTSTDPLKSSVYRMLAAAFAQSPRPAAVKVGKRTTPQIQTVKFGVVGVAQNSTVYRFTMTRGIVTADIIFTSPGAGTTISGIVTGLANAVVASTFGFSVGATPQDGNTTCQVIEPSATGIQTYYSNWSANLTFSDITADPGIATDLAAISNHDDDEYFWTVDHNCKAISLAMSNYVETLDVGEFLTNLSDSALFDPASTTDLAYVLKSQSQGRTGVYFDLNDTAGYSGVAAAAERAPHDPGQDGAGGTFHGKTLRTVTSDPINPTQKSALRAKNVVVYITTASRNHTLDGKTAGGEFLDIVRGRDWFKIRTEERIAAAILDNDKIPYTDRGISIIKSLLDAQGAQAEQVELFVPGSFSSSAPTRAQTTTADRSARKLTGLKFTAIFAGAIHLVDPVSGTLTT